jgi:hypothetical protein
MLVRFEEVIYRRYSKVKSLDKLLKWQHGWMEDKQKKIDVKEVLNPVQTK